MLMTLFMLGIGSYTECFGPSPRRSSSPAHQHIGRILAYSRTATPPIGTLTTIAIIGSIIVVASVQHPFGRVLGVGRYTDRRTATIGYGLVYAVVDLGIITSAPPPWIRPPFSELKTKTTTEAIRSP